MSILTLATSDVQLASVRTRVDGMFTESGILETVLWEGSTPGREQRLESIQE